MTFTSPNDPVAAAQASNDTNIRGNNQRSITALALHTTLAAIIGATAAVGGMALVGGPGVGVIPEGVNASVCLGPGQSVTLPTGARANTQISVDDCSQSQGPGPLASPETILASSDATIAGASSYVLTLINQGVVFRKSAAGPWQPE